jgi:acyl-CoA synthetase (AMP-forming)/AMP-acid ligase II
VTDRTLPIDATPTAAFGDEIAMLQVTNRPSLRAYQPSLVIKLTSGSTALPKAALASEMSLMHDGQNIVAAMGIRPDDINLAAIPLSHAYALGNIIMPLVLQGTAAALRPSFSPSQFVRDAQVSGATVFPGVPFMFEHLRALLQHQRLPPALRLLITAGARIDASTVQWFYEHGGRKIHSLYGTSETGGITFDASEALSDPLHVGRPLPGVTVEIMSAGASGSGRVFVRGDALASGYLNPAGGDDSSAFQRGGFLTADLGYLDPLGPLVLTGRVSALINVAGRKVDPAEVERVLTSLAGVTDARVVGVDCHRRGQELVAFIVRGAPAPTPIALRQSCADALSPYKIPRRFIWLDRWPVDSRGKLDRRALEALAAET